MYRVRRTHRGSAADAKNCVILRKEDFICLTGRRLSALSDRNITKKQLGQAFQLSQHGQMRRMLEISKQIVLIGKLGYQHVVRCLRIGHGIESAAPCPDQRDLARQIKHSRVKLKRRAALRGDAGQQLEQDDVGNHGFTDSVRQNPAA